MNERFVLIFHSTKDITLSISVSFEIIHDTTVVTNTLLLAIVRVQRTVTSWLVGVEVTLYQETRNTMVQYAKVTGISLTRRWKSSIIAAMIEINISQNVLRRLWVTGVVVVWLETRHRAALKSMIPRCLTHFDSTWHYVLTSVVTTIEVRQIVNGVTIGSRIRVNRDEVVHVVSLCLVSDFEQWTVILLKVRQLLICLPCIIRIFTIHFLVWPRTSLGV